MTTLSPPSYLQHLRAYLNNEYVVHDGSDERVVLTEHFFRPEDVRPQLRRVELLLPGPGMAFKLDHDDFEISKKKAKPALFHFLDDNSKPWSKRCDFVIFYVQGRSFHADCIEFKSKSLNAETIKAQLNAGVCWVRATKETIEHYTSYTRRIRLRKFVFGTNERPDPFVDGNRQLNADPSIRYYHFDEVSGRSLADLENTSVQEI